MWQKMLLFICFITWHVTSHQIKVTCDKCLEFPSTSTKANPSKVADLKVVQVKNGEEVKLNISWAINIDGSFLTLILDSVEFQVLNFIYTCILLITCFYPELYTDKNLTIPFASNNYLTGTWITISGEPDYLCEYNPPFAKANLTGSEQKWFHFLVSAREGFYSIEVFNLPLPPLGGDHSPMHKTIQIPFPTKSRVITKSQPTAKTEPIVQADAFTEPPPPEAKAKAVIIITLVGVLATLMILSSCCIIYKRCISTSASYLSVKSHPVVPVSVLMVYPAENSAFQRAVVALAEFLQLHGGCSVAIDVWQQGRIAGLGPLRWLAEQEKAADRVLIVSPPGETRSLLSQSTANHNLPEHPIPAAAHDLYPLILNMLTGRAKNASQLSRFWVVHLNKKPAVILPELKACTSFCLMKDLNKLCESLHAPRKFGKKISSLLFKPGISYSKNSTKLREAVEMLERGANQAHPERS